MFKKFKDAIFNTFKKSQKDSLTPEDLIDREIAQQEEQLFQQKDKESVVKIIKNISCLKAKKLSITNKNGYIEHAFSLLTTRNEDNILEIIYYLKSVPLEQLSPHEQSDILYLQALFYEAILDIENAKKYYKMAIDKNADTSKLQEYKNFIQKYTPKKRQQQNNSTKHIHTIDPSTPNEELLKRANTLEQLALRYAKSPKSRALGKSYFKEVMYIHRELNSRSNSYQCEYIRILLDGVEIFMFSPIYLKKAIDMLKDGEICKEQRVYFSERVNYLKNKSFIKHSKVFNT